MRKRHRYVTVLQDSDTGQILAMIAPSQRCEPRGQVTPGPWRGVPLKASSDIHHLYVGMADMLSDGIIAQFPDQF